jgi:hypothetical protein
MVETFSIEKEKWERLSQPRKKNGGEVLNRERGMGETFSTEKEKWGRHSRPRKKNGGDILNRERKMRPS